MLKKWGSWFLERSCTPSLRCDYCEEKLETNYCIFATYKNSLKTRARYHLSCFLDHHPKACPELMKQFENELVADKL